jgi:hypothetical protein
MREIRKNSSSGILVVGTDSCSYSKTPESIPCDQLFREAETSVFGLFVNQIPILLFEYEYRFTEYEYEKNQWYELPATIMPDGPFLLGRFG